jgi:two-component system nitrogen regulation sensor histidine kinase NtrY
MVLVFDDYTQLVKAQRMVAWREVARRIAHEIKNPLTPIQLSAQRIRKAYLKGAPDLERIVSECTEAIVREVEALKNLVDEFAQFARLPAVNLQQASLDDVVVHTLSLYDGFAGVTIDRRLAPDLPSLRLDSAQMKRVLINLVDNAIKYTPREGSIRVDVRIRGDAEAAVEIADSGPGIAPEHRQRIFERFYRVDRARSRETGGTGLGLAIVRHVATNHGGNVSVTSQEGAGSTFTLRIPAGPGPVIVSLQPSDRQGSPMEETG